MIPFDAGLLDRLMEEAGIDVLLACSKHNIQYLLGGYRFFFFEHMDAMGLSRYLPLLIYPKRAPDKASYIGHRLESHMREVWPFWVPELQTSSSGTQDAMEQAVSHIRRLGLEAGRIGIEAPFLPADAHESLRRALPSAEMRDSVVVLERLRARKTPDELDKLRIASERVVDSMVAVMASHGQGTTKRELVEALRREEVSRGLTFDYCLITAGTNLNRAPSDAPWREGDTLSLDSGGNYQGYIGDLCRMAILGEPDNELQDLLGEVASVQQAAMEAAQPGIPGGRIYSGTDAVLARSPHREHIRFVAHGMGLISHEAPHLERHAGVGPVLEPGMVISIETTMQHPRRGFIKLEDTVAVREHGPEMLGGSARGWNRGNLNLCPS